MSREDTTSSTATTDTGPVVNVPLNELESSSDRNDDSCDVRIRKLEQVEVEEAITNVENGLLEQTIVVEADIDTLPVHDGMDHVSTHSQELKSEETKGIENSYNLTRLNVRNNDNNSDGNSKKRKFDDSTTELPSNETRFVESIVPVTTKTTTTTTHIDSMPIKEEQIVHTVDVANRVSVSSSLPVPAPVDNLEAVKAAARAFALSSSTTTTKKSNKSKQRRHHSQTSLDLHHQSTPDLTHNDSKYRSSDGVQHYYDKHRSSRIYSSTQPHHIHLAPSGLKGASIGSLHHHGASSYQHISTRDNIPCKTPNPKQKILHDYYSKPNDNQRLKPYELDDKSRTVVSTTGVSVDLKHDSSAVERMGQHNDPDDDNLDEYARFVKLIGLDANDEESWKFKDDDDDEFQLDFTEEEEDDDDDDDDDEGELNESQSTDLDNSTKYLNIATTSACHDESNFAQNSHVPEEDVVSDARSHPIESYGSENESWDENFYHELDEEIGGLEEEDMEAAVATLLIECPNGNSNSSTLTSSAKKQRLLSGGRGDEVPASPSLPLSFSPLTPQVTSVIDFVAGQEKNSLERKKYKRSEGAGEHSLSGNDENILPPIPEPLKTSIFTRNLGQPSTFAPKNSLIVTPRQQLQLRQLLEKHYQLLVQHAILAVRAAHSQRIKRAPANLADKDSSPLGSNVSEFTAGNESSDDLAEILDGAVGMLQDLDQNRKDAIRHFVQFRDSFAPLGRRRIGVGVSGRSPTRRSLMAELMDNDYNKNNTSSTPGTEKRLTRAQFSKTLMEQTNEQHLTVFNIPGLNKLKETFDIIDHSVEGVCAPGTSSILQFSTNYKTCRHVLEQAGAHVEEELVPGSRDVATNFVDVKEYFGDQFKPPCSPEQELTLRRNRTLFTSGEDNLVLRGVNLYGEKQWTLIADRFLPDRNINMISQRYSKLCYLLYKAHDIYIDDKGNLVKPPTLESVDDIDEVALSTLKKVDPPAILNVHRWSLEEDLTLLKAVPIMGSMWAELRARLIPHRDRGHLRKRYQVLERRVKATVARVEKHEKNILVKLPPPIVPVAKASTRAQPTKTSSVRKQHFPPLPPPAIPPSTSRVGGKNLKPPTTVDQAASILARTRTGSVGKSSYQQPTAVVPPSNPQHSSPPRESPAVHPYNSQHFSSMPHNASPQSSSFHHQHPGAPVMYPYPHHHYVHPMHPPPPYHHHLSPPPPYHHQYHPHPMHYHPPYPPQQASRQFADDSSVLAYEKLVAQSSQDWSHMSAMKNGLSANEDTTSKQETSEPIADENLTTGMVDNQFSKDSFSELKLDDAPSCFASLADYKPSPLKMITAEEQATESVSFLAGVLERSNHSRQLLERENEERTNPTQSHTESNTSFDTNDVHEFMKSPRKRLGHLESSTPTTRTSIFSNPGTPFGLSPGFRMSPNSKNGLTPESNRLQHFHSETPHGATLDTFPGGESLDFDTNGFFQSRMTLPSRLEFGSSPDANKSNPRRAELFGDGAPLLENDLVAISALNELSNSPAKPSYVTRSAMGTNFHNDEKKKGGTVDGTKKSLFDQVVGNKHQHSMSSSSRKSTVPKKRKLQF